jgi:ABC-type nitrate/sulfonate/bicarbonate transport system ATPase subunit
VERSCPHELSGGMRQRLALARALCPGPRILVMDEPFAAVDEPTRHHLQNELLAVWAADRQTVLFATHSIEEAVYLADRVVVMTFGRAVDVMLLDLPRPRDRLADTARPRCAPDLGLRGTGRSRARSGPARGPSPAAAAAPGAPDPAL